MLMVDNAYEAGRFISAIADVISHLSCDGARTRLFLLRAYHGTFSHRGARAALAAQPLSYH